MRCDAIILFFFIFFCILTLLYVVHVISFSRFLTCIIYLLHYHDAVVDIYNYTFILLASHSSSLIYAHHTSCFVYNLIYLIHTSFYAIKSVNNFLCFLSFSFITSLAVFAGVSNVICFVIYFLRFLYTLYFFFFYIFRFLLILLMLCEK